jgi:hypothetical protein
MRFSLEQTRLQENIKLAKLDPYFLFAFPPGIGVLLMLLAGGMV